MVKKKDKDGKGGGKKGGASAGPPPDPFMLVTEAGFLDSPDDLCEGGDGSLAVSGIGHLSWEGTAPHANEDAVVAALAVPCGPSGGSAAVFGVMDGHGGGGTVALAPAALLGAVKSKMAYQSMEPVYSLMSEALHQVDAQVRSKLDKGDGSGACVCVCLLLGQTLVTCNLGDCRCVLRRASTGVATRVSRDQTATSEQDRILAAGGYIDCDGMAMGMLQPARCITRGLPMQDRDTPAAPRSRLLACSYYTTPVPWGFRCESNELKGMHPPLHTWDPAPLTLNRPADSACCMALTAFIPMRPGDSGAARDFEPGDVVLVCTDGVWDAVGDQVHLLPHSNPLLPSPPRPNVHQEAADIAAKVLGGHGMKKGTPEDAAKALLQAAKNGKSLDDKTALVAVIGA
eukprot:gene6004-1071_t